MSGPTAVRRALIIGGTGMLADVARTLVSRGTETTVVARSATRAPAGTVGIAVDYRDTDAFVDAIRNAGPFDVAVAWIHSVAPDAPLALARVVAEGRYPVRYVHVLGSAAADPSVPDTGRRDAFEAVPGVTYEEVILGFVREGRGSRWLRNDEIAAGVLGAVDAPSARTIVGVVEPWDARP